MCDLGVRWSLEWVGVIHFGRFGPVEAASEVQVCWTPPYLVPPWKKKAPIDTHIIIYPFLLNWTICPQTNTLTSSWSKIQHTSHTVTHILLYWKTGALSYFLWLRAIWFIHWDSDFEFELSWSLNLSFYVELNLCWAIFYCLPYAVKKFPHGKNLPPHGKNDKFP